MKVTHEILIKLATLLGHKREELCGWLDYELTQAVLDQQEEAVYAKLDFIGTYNNKLPLLIEEIEEAQKKPKEQLTEKESNLLGISDFFDSLNKPQGNHDKLGFMLLNKGHVFTSEALASFLTDLSRILSTDKSNHTITLNSPMHAVSLRYDNTKSLWRYINISDFSKFLGRKEYFREISTQTLTSSLFDAFEINEMMAINIYLLSTQNDTSLKKSLESLDKKHPFGKRQIKAINSTNLLYLFYLACSEGHIDIAKNILEHSFIDPDKIVYQNATAFFIACQKGRSNIVKMLLESNNTLNINHLGPDNATPLYTACLEGHLETVKILLASKKFKININLINTARRNPLHATCTFGHAEILQVLLESGMSNKVNDQDIDGATPLNIACYRGHTKTVKTLLDSKYDIDTNLPCAHKRSPLYNACCEGHIEIVTLLLEAKYKIDIDQECDEGFTPLLVACLHGHIAIAIKLIEHGANINKVINGHTPLSIAYASYNENKLELINMLLNYGVDLSYQFETYGTAIDMVFLKNDEIEIQTLLQMKYVKDYPVLTIMSEETLVKAKQWASSTSRINLLAYLNEDPFSSYTFYPGIDTGKTKDIEAINTETLEQIIKNTARTI